MVKIGKAANGYIVEVCVPFTKPAKGSDMMCGMSEGETQYVCKNEAEVAAKVTALLPLLDGEYTDQKAFEKAFGAAVLEDEEGD
jgi:hypothetical protein